MKRFGLLFLISCTAGVTGSLAHAGANGSGGGDAIICKRWGQPETVALADTFGLHDSQELSVAKKMGRLPEPMFSDTMFELTVPANADSMNFPELLKQRKKELRIEFTENDLPELNDDYLEYELTPKQKKVCRKQQLAIQDRATKRVLINAPLYRRLSKFEQQMLEVHETLISIFPEVRDTRAIRGLVRQPISVLFHSLVLAQTDALLAQAGAGPIHDGTDARYRFEVAFAMAVSAATGQDYAAVVSQRGHDLAQVANDVLYNLNVIAWNSPWGICEYGQPYFHQSSKRERKEIKRMISNALSVRGQALPAIIESVKPIYCQ